MRPSLLAVLDAAVPFAVPLRVPFRGVERRVGLLIPGPSGWGEFSPFDNYAPVMAARWLASALEAAYDGWPAPVRSDVAVNVIVPAVPAEQVAEVLAHAAAAEDSEVARSAPDAGASESAMTVKVKVTGDLAADAARVAAVRAAAGPAARIRLDVNAGWTYEQALRDLPVLAAAADGLEYVEQPLASLAEIADLRRATGVPVAVDETLRLATDPFDPAMLAQVRASADVAVLKVAPLGGVRAALRLAEALQMPVVVSGAMETSVGLAAGLAAACALPAEPLACGLGTGSLLAADVIPVPLRPRDGRLSPVTVEPDAWALAAARAAVTQQEEAELLRRLQRAWEYV